MALPQCVRKDAKRRLRAVFVPGPPRRNGSIDRHWLKNPVVQLAALSILQALPLPPPPLLVSFRDSGYERAASLVLTLAAREPLLAPAQPSVSPPEPARGGMLRCPWSLPAHFPPASQW